MIQMNEYIKCLDLAQEYADENSTCCKVRVGAMIRPKEGGQIFGANHGVCNCRKNGCRRIKLYGENSKEHRLPSDCDSIHSEVDAIGAIAGCHCSSEGATIFVTRYPCEACARAIVAAGISTVVYGREQEISEYTDEIFADAEVNIIHISTWRRDDVTT